MDVIKHHRYRGFKVEGFMPSWSMFFIVGYSRHEQPLDASRYYPFIKFWLVVELPYTGTAVSTTILKGEKALMDGCLLYEP